MKKLAFIALLMPYPMYAMAESTIKLNKAIVRGETISIGQEAGIVQSRIKADKFISSGYNPGDTSKGYYKDKGDTYIITYGPPKGDAGPYVPYVVIKIEKIVHK